MVHFLYIIQSETSGRYYVGSSHDPSLRVQHHNDGWTRSTKSGRPWKLIYIKRYSSKIQALRREREIKAMKSRKYIERLLADTEGRPDL